MISEEREKKFDPTVLRLISASLLSDCVSGWTGGSVAKTCADREVAYM